MINKQVTLNNIFEGIKDSIIKNNASLSSIMPFEDKFNCNIDLNMIFVRLHLFEDMTVEDSDNINFSFIVNTPNVYSFWSDSETNAYSLAKESLSSYAYELWIELKSMNKDALEAEINLIYKADGFNINIDYSFNRLSEIDRLGLHHKWEHGVLDSTVNIRKMN